MRPPAAALLALPLVLGCRSMTTEPAALDPAGTSSVGAMRTGDVVVTTKIEERGDELFELLVEVERIREDGSREVLGSPRILLASGQNAEIGHAEGDSRISVLATLPETGSSGDALIEVSMIEGTTRTATPQMVVPMPTVELPEGEVRKEPAQMVSVTCLDEDVHTVVASIARQADKSIAVSNAIRGKVTLNVHDISWYRALELALEPLALRATAEDADGEVLRVDRSPTVTQYCQVWLNFIDEDFQRVLNSIAEQAGIDVLADASITGNLTLRAEGVSWLTALEAAAEAVGCIVCVSRDGTTVRVIPG